MKYSTPIFSLNALCCKKNLFPVLWTLYYWLNVWMGLAVWGKVMIGFKENNQWAGLGTGIAIKKLYLWRLRCIQIFIPNPDCPFPQNNEYDNLYDGYWFSRTHSSVFEYCLVNQCFILVLKRNEKLLLILLYLEAYIDDH